MSPKVREFEVSSLPYRDGTIRHLVTTPGPDMVLFYQGTEQLTNRPALFDDPDVIEGLLARDFPGSGVTWLKGTR